MDQPQYWLRLHAPDPLIRQHINDLRKEVSLVASVLLFVHSRWAGSTFSFLFVLFDIQSISPGCLQLWEHELMECTFKPQVNPHKDEEQAPGEAGSSSRFEQLFMDAENRVKRHAEYVQCYPK